MLFIGIACAAVPWTKVLTEQALQTGAHATLPPNVSGILGLGDPGKSVEVRQLIARDGHEVRTFNVSVAQHRDLVIFKVDEKAATAVAYLLAPGGRLRSAVSYHTGGQPQPLQPDQARAGFAREVRFWSGRAAPAAPTGKP
jgi:hypothetical protein